MQVVSTLKGGFTQIFTSEHPGTVYDEPRKKKPYIVFVLDWTEDDWKYVIDNKLDKVGIVTFKNNQIVVTVTSDRKVSDAIDFYLKSMRYAVASNTELRKLLREYQKTCKESLQTKPKKTIALKSELSSNFEKKTTGPQLPTSANTTRRVIRTKTGEEFISKENPARRSISELEAFNGYCYRLLLGNRHPQVMPSHGKRGNKKSHLSKWDDKFESLQDRYKRTGSFPTSEELLKGQVSKVWAAAYVEEENDLHGGNYGIGANGFCVKLDDDQSTWPLTSKYKGIDPEKGCPELKYSVAPVKSFPVTARDILNLPNLQDAKPRNWLNTADSQKVDTNYFVNNKKFIEEKYYMFLKRILMPKEAYKAIGVATISSEKKRKEFVEHKCNKTEELKTVLLSMPEFQQYVISHPQAINEIKAELEVYNQDFKEEKDAFLRVDLAKIEKEYCEIEKICQQHQSKFNPVKEDIIVELDNSKIDLLPQKNQPPLLQQSIFSNVNLNNKYKINPETLVINKL